VERNVKVERPRSFSDATPLDWQSVGNLADRIVAGMKVGKSVEFDRSQAAAKIVTAGVKGQGRRAP
jgi:hypothetical protein